MRKGWSYGRSCPCLSWRRAPMRSYSVRVLHYMRVFCSNGGVSVKLKVSTPHPGRSGVDAYKRESSSMEGIARDQFRKARRVIKARFKTLGCSSVPPRRALEHLLNMLRQQDSGHFLQGRPTCLRFDPCKRGVSSHRAVEVGPWK